MDMIPYWVTFANSPSSTLLLKSVANLSGSPGSREALASFTNSQTQPWIWSIERDALDRVSGPIMVLYPFLHFDMVCNALGWAILRSGEDSNVRLPA